MAKHKKHKWVTGSEEKEVFDLLDRGKGVPAIVRETGISRSKVYQLKKEQDSSHLKYDEPPVGVQKRCAAGKHDYKFEHFTTPDAQLMWRNVCQFCGQPEVLDIPTGTYHLTEGAGDQ